MLAKVVNQPDIRVDVLFQPLYRRSFIEVTDRPRMLSDSVNNDLCRWYSLAFINPIRRLIDNANMSPKQLLTTLKKSRVLT